MSFNASQVKIVKFVLFEGVNSLTILGIHAVVQTALFMFLKVFLQPSVCFYVVAFILELIVVNICVIGFNRYVPYLVNKKV